MKNFTHIILFLFTAHLALAQTGPGGVGNASTNVLWLKPDAITGLADGANISSWIDLSGNGNHVTQPTAGFTPEFKTNIVNGQPVVRFNKVNGRIRKTSFTGFPTTAITEIYVNRNNGNHNDGILSYASSSHHNDFLVYSSSSMHIYRGLNNHTGLDLNNNVFNVVNVSWRSSDGKEEAWLNGSNSYNNTGHATGSPITTGGCFAIAGEQDLVDGGYAANQAHFGDFGEVIVYNYYLNRAQQIIVSNSLAAKYGLALTANDYYDEDNPANGNYDHEVAGIGRVDASNLHNSAKGSGIVHILNPTNLGNDEFLLWGHNNALQQAGQTTDVPSGVQARFVRVWRASEVNTSNSAVDVGAIDMRFDLTGLGPVTVSDLRLLVDTDNDGVFNDETPISGATSLGGNIYQFAGVTAIANNLRFTLGTINISQTPLPVELINFTANIWEGRSVKLAWQTASEINNSHFTIERTADGTNWEELQTINGAGNSTSLLDYNTIDSQPLNGLSYYRLKQTDFDGKSSYSEIRSVNMKQDEEIRLTIFPNPTDHKINVVGNESELKFVRLYDALGNDVTALTEFIFQSESQLIIDLSNLSSGVYLMKTKSETYKISKN